MIYKNIKNYLEICLKVMEDKKWRIGENCDTKKIITWANFSISMFCSFPLFVAIRNIFIYKYHIRLTNFKPDLLIKT